MILDYGVYGLRSRTGAALDEAGATILCLAHGLFLTIVLIGLDALGMK